MEEEKKILDTMQAFIDDNAFATELKSSGKYNPASKRKKIFSVQENLIESTKVEIAKQMEASLRRRTSGKTKDQSEGDQENSNPIIGSLDIQSKMPTIQRGGESGRFQSNFINSSILTVP